MAKEFIVPGRIISGAGALTMAEAALGTLGRKAMIVTDQVMIQLGNCAKVEAALRSQGVDYIIYDGITGEPTDKMIETGLKLYKEAGCDFLVALGGGSPIDSMKAIGSLAANGGRIADYMGKVIDVPMPPMAAIPTTAGTGSEATQFTIIHGMSRPIGALFHVAHGLSNAMLMKECLTFALEGAYDRFADLGRAIGAASGADSDRAASEKFLSAVTALTEELETPTLAQYGIDRETFFNVIDKMAHDAMESGSPQNTMRDVTEEDVREIYRKLW